MQSRCLVITAIHSVLTTLVVINNVCSGMRPPIPDHISPQVVDIIRRCWAHRPEERPDFPAVLAEMSSCMF